MSKPHESAQISEKDFEESTLSKDIISLLLNEDGIKTVHRVLFISVIITCLISISCILFDLAVFGLILGAVGLLLLYCFFSEKKRGHRILTSMKEGTFIIFPATLYAIRTYVNNGGDVDSHTDYFVFSISNGSRTFKWCQVYALNAGDIEVGQSCYVVAFPNGKGYYTPTQFYLQEGEYGITNIGSDLSQQYTEDPPPIDPQYNYYK